jgi:hypothetical protein
MNAVCLCAGHHVWYTNNPNAWDKIVKKVFPKKFKFVEKHQSDIWDKNIEKVYDDLLVKQGY